MFTAKEYKQAESLEQAYELNQKRSSRILGGMLWLKMSRASYGTVIDLSGLGLDTIEEDEEAFRIGCMATLRDLELHEGLNAWTRGAVRKSVCHIVGVQFRNLATVGGSIFGRFGFSDVLTMFLALDSYVELYKGGIRTLEEFAASPRDKDILVRLIVRKTPVRCHYLSMRNTKTDFPVLACAVASGAEGYRAVIGARPGRAMLVRDSQGILMDGVNEKTAEAFGSWLRAQVPVGSNMRAGAEYRGRLVEVLSRRALLAMEGEG